MFQDAKSPTASSDSEYDVFKVTLAANNLQCILTSTLFSHGHWHDTSSGNSRFFIER